MLSRTIISRLGQFRYSTVNKHLDTFPRRHLGIDDIKINEMIQDMGYNSVDHLLNDVIPDKIRISQWDKTEIIPKIGHSETKALIEMKKIAKMNKSNYKNCIGLGYHGTTTPSVIQRMILENPNWYTPYTPYQAEISQGRMESLFNFQTMICDLTGMSYANASLLDEATACIEAMMLSYNFVGGMKKGENKRRVYVVDQNCHPQNLLVLQGRASQLNIKIWLVDGVLNAIDYIENHDDVFGCLIQYPNTYGEIYDPSLIQKLSNTHGLTTLVCDPMALVMLKSPGELGADIALGSAQRFGVPMGGGGPHPAFFAVREPKLVRLMPGRMIGMSEGSFRLTLQTREQHIKREKATSNICTAQALLANVAVNYAVYHGPKGLREISEKIHNLAKILAYYIENADNITGKANLYELLNKNFYDTIRIKYGFSHLLKYDDHSNHFNMRFSNNNEFSITIDETWTLDNVLNLVSTLLHVNIRESRFTIDENNIHDLGISKHMLRTDPILTSMVFNKYHTETEMMRYLEYLQRKDLSLTNSMIPLGSCTMKLNSTTEMTPISWPEFSNVHPYAPDNQVKGYSYLSSQLRSWLSEITGFADVTLQPISGALGEYTGLVVIANYLRNTDVNKCWKRTICLIPDSAHGTNPASARLAGYTVITVKTDTMGNVDFDHLNTLVEKHKDEIGCLMITYPSTFGVFEDRVMDICNLIHNVGGQIYMDGANMNAQIGLTSPGFIGADVCHLNLHKTFCIPHGGGGPGMGPIGVAEHLVPYLPAQIHYNNLEHNDVVDMVKHGKLSNTLNIWPVSGSSFFGSGMILPIPYQYIAMMGKDGLLNASKGAIVSANYMKYRLMGTYPILYTNKNGGVAHEFIIDVRKEQKRTGITVMDIAKRLQDFGLHAGTCSWPIPGIMMLEPTESESKEEIDRYCDALLKIKSEIDHIYNQIQILSETNDKEGIKNIKHNNILKNAPHSIDSILDTEWDLKYYYSRENAVYPLGKKWGERKHWPVVGRINDAIGDRNLIVNWHMSNNKK